jgi:hypothetical protein
MRWRAPWLTQLVGLTRARGLWRIRRRRISFSRLSDRPPLALIGCSLSCAREARLLRKILGLDEADRLDGAQICRQIEEVIAGIEAQAAGKELKLALSVRLGERSELSAVIRRASGNEIEINDTDAQLRFVIDDLSEEPFVAKIQQDKGADKPALFGSQLTYFLSQYHQPNSTEQANWEFAVCERAQKGRPYSVANASIQPKILDVLESRDAIKSFLDVAVELLVGTISSAQ